MRQPSARKHRSQASSLILENPPRPNQTNKESEDSGHFNEPRVPPQHVPTGHPPRKRFGRSHPNEDRIAGLTPIRRLCQYCPTSRALRLYIYFFFPFSR